jgi:8-amino-7-oxononanoate synthase
MSEIQFPNHLAHLLDQRTNLNSFRKLKVSYPSIDFSSNDYLGFSSSGLLLQKTKSLNITKSGATGSRLISGNTEICISLEKEIATFHNAQSALIFNSGYDANLGLLSSVPQKGDLILSDELIHASLIDGIRLSFAKNFKFQHNNITHLIELLERHKDTANAIFIVVESVYSMDGDNAPLIELVEVSKKYNCFLIVDEAHAIGVFGNQGRGLCNELNVEKECFARIYTYGKAMGCHGAAIVGSKKLCEYLINFSRSFIYTTALPEHSLFTIKTAYKELLQTNEINQLKKLIAYFNQKTIADESYIKSNSSIHCKLVVGNKQVDKIENELEKNNLFVKSIKSPTVKAGKERLRICLHSFNTFDEIDKLLEVLS